MTPDELREAASGWYLRRIDSQRWEVTDGERWAPLPRVLAPHPMLGEVVTFPARFAPRPVAQEALDAFRRGERAPMYRYAQDGSLEKVCANRT